MGLTNKFLAKSVLVTGNFFSDEEKQQGGERIYLQQVTNEKVKAESNL